MSDDNLCQIQLGQIAVIANGLAYQVTQVDARHVILNLPDEEFSIPLHLTVDPRPSFEVGYAEGTSLIVKIYDHELPDYRPDELVTLETMTALNKLVEVRHSTPKSRPRTSFIALPGGVSCVGGFKSRERANSICRPGFSGGNL